MDFSIMFFSGSARDDQQTGRYDQIQHAARIADETGLTRIWMPERHFVQFGALHPNPSLLAANLASTTKNIRLAAGSVVAPLHDSIRIAEEWSVVDNLSGGRADIALASGWLSSDFSLAPDRYSTRHRQLRKHVREVRDLWAGASLTREVEGRSHSIKIRPRPVQPTLPLWITAARSVETFRYAGSVGANVLTYLVDLGFEGLEAAIAAYREAREENGFDADEGVVTVMVHCCLGENSETVRQKVTGPYRKYLFDNRELLLQLDRPIDAIDDKTFAEMADIQFERVFENLSLIGSFAAAQKTLDRLTAIGIGEVACLIDFAEEDSMTIDAVRDIATLKESYAKRAASAELASVSDGSDLVADRAEFYDYIGTLGGFYGDEFRLVERVKLSGDEAETELLVEDTSEQGKAILVDAIISTAHAFALRPGLRGASVPLAMPAGVGSMSIDEVVPGVLTVRTVAKGRQGDIDYFDAVAHDANGRKVVELEDIAFNRFKLPSSDPRVIAASNVIHTIAWDKAKPAQSAPETMKVVLHAQDPDVGTSWKQAFTEAGLATSLASELAGRPADEVGAQHILVLPEADNEDGLEQAQAATLEIADWVNSLTEAKRDIPWAVVTRNAQRISDQDPMPSAVSAAAWAAAASQTQLGGSADQGVIDVDQIDKRTASTIADCLASEMLPAAIRAGEVFQMGLTSAEASIETGTPISEQLAGTKSVVLGGSGALGSNLISWLEEEGSSAIASVSRGGLREGRAGVARAKLDDCIADAGTEPVANVLQSSGLNPDDYDTIFHLAGVDKPELDGVTSDSVAEAFAPKLGAAEQLRSILQGAEKPVHVVFFSSLAALRGSQGQTAYSAANAATSAALKNLVRDTPHKVTVVHFGPWGGDGMAAASQLDAIFKLKGVERLQPQIALRALGLVLATGKEETAIVQFPDQAEQPMTDASSASVIVELDPKETESAALQSLHDIPQDQRRDALVSRLQVMIAEALETEVEEVDAATNLYDLGFDSLMAVELRNQLSEEYAIEVGLVVLMDAQTIDDVVDRLMPIVEKALEQETVEEAESYSEETVIL